MASGPVPVGTVTCVDPTTIAASVALAGSCCLVSLASCWLALAHIERLTPSLAGPLCHWFGASLRNRLKDQVIWLALCASPYGGFLECLPSSRCCSSGGLFLDPQVAASASSAYGYSLGRRLSLALPVAGLGSESFVFKLVGPRPDRRHLSHIGDTNTDSRRLGYASVQSTDKKMRTTKLGAIRNPPKVTTIEYAIIQHCTA